MSVVTVIKEIRFLSHNSSVFFPTTSPLMLKMTQSRVRERAVGLCVCVALAEDSSSSLQVEKNIFCHFLKYIKYSMSHVNYAN